jgi:hypothetical protein
VKLAAVAVSAVSLELMTDYFITTSGCYNLPALPKPIQHLPKERLGRGFSTRSSLAIQFVSFNFTLFAWTHVGRPV